jgi:hypothetical protein
VRALMTPQKVNLGRTRIWVRCPEVQAKLAFNRLRNYREIDETNCLAQVGAANRATSRVTFLSSGRGLWIVDHFVVYTRADFFEALSRGLK